MCASANNQKILEQLFISPKTVSNHISDIFNKLQDCDGA
ncbi:MAG: DNA-binding CsgD family transcriptional regulator [Cellvibrionaceae bacterium]|jgi:DNA-binding CsgD family transcriptional regulator